jgi:hypothetical protein
MGWDGVHIGLLLLVFFFFCSPSTTASNRSVGATFQVSSIASHATSECVSECMSVFVLPIWMVNQVLFNRDFFSRSLPCFLFFFFLV